MDLTDPIQDQIALFALGAVDEQERRAIEAHLAKCPRCRDRLEAARSAAGLLPEALDPILPFDSSRERLFARVRADSGARGIRPLLTFFSSLPTRFGHFARRSMPRHR